MKLLTTSLITTALTLATISSASAVRTERTTLENVFANASGDAFVRLNSNKDDQGNVCSSNSRYKIDGGDAGSNALIAAALTAKASDVEVQLDLSACVIDAVINNVIVY